jgi:hypothetical protein
MIPGRVSTSQKVKPAVLPAPVGGLNGRDPLTAMPPTDAYELDNYIVGVSSIRSRRGSIPYSSTQLGAPGGSAVEALEVYAGADGDQMLAWSDQYIYDVSLAAPASLLSGYQSAATVISAMFSNASDNAQHMIFVSGFDLPMQYDGSAISTLTMTGDSDGSTFNFVFAFKERLYFAERDKLGFYYLAVGAIQGAVTYFDLAQVSRSGGYLLAIASYSEGGETPQDYIVFITSKGECILYAGFDPGSATDWVLVGRYFAATPIGARCAIPYGGDLLVLTLQGAVSLAKIKSKGDAISGGVIGAEFEAVTAKLGHYLSDLNIYADEPVWRGLVYPREGWLILNAAANAAGDVYQFLMNVTTNAWFKFSGWNALCWTVFNDRLYFGREDGYVVLADEGSVDIIEPGIGPEDNFTPFTATVKQAYNLFDDPAIKHFQWVTVIGAYHTEEAATDVNISVSFHTDYTENAADTFVSTFPTNFPDGGFSRIPININTDGVAGSFGVAFVSGIDAYFEWSASHYAVEPTASLLP